VGRGRRGGKGGIYGGREGSLDSFFPLGAALGADVEFGADEAAGGAEALSFAV